MTRSILDPDFSLVEVLPASIAHHREIIAMSKALDPEIRAVAAAIIEANILPNIATVPEDVLDEIAWANNLSTLQIWDVADVDLKRAVLTNILEVRKKSGTVYAVQRTFTLMNLDADIVEWFNETDFTIPGAGQPYTYRIRIFLDEAASFTASQWIQLWELTYRFERASVQLVQLATEIDESGPLDIYPAPQTGRLVTVGFFGG
jgi:phage tail P2-like protein